MPKININCTYFTKIFMFFLLSFAMYLKIYYFCKN